jgi:hypothetical protein
MAKLIKMLYINRKTASNDERANAMAGAKKNCE